MAVDAAGRLADVDAQVGRAFDVGDDLDRRHDGAQVAGHRRLQGDDAEARLLELQRSGVVGGVTVDHVLGRFEVEVEQHLGRPRDQFGHPGRHAGDADADLVEALVERLAQDLWLRHQPNRPVM